MDHQSVLVTGGAGFVGSTLAIALKTRHPSLRVLCLDNLKRRGSELNLPRLRDHDIAFLHGDIRNPEDLRAVEDVELLIECSAEPSVLAGFGDDPAYVVNTNLVGTVNCLEFARRVRADVVFLSTSRVYPWDALNRVATHETETRFTLAERQPVAGVSARGVSEDCSVIGPRSLYGTTKLCSELLVQEYGAMYGVRSIIDRCGVLTGPWQMGKVDQGVFALWMARHYFGGTLRYIGWGGSGKQVRDLLHVDDLVDLVERQVAAIDRLNGRVFNVGGGAAGSLSLRETTLLCQEITGRTIPVHASAEDRPADLRIYISDTTRVTDATGWLPRHSPHETLVAIYDWMHAHEAQLRPLWAG